MIAQNRRVSLRVLTVTVIAAMLMTLLAPMAVFASDARNAGPVMNPHEFLDQFQPRPFPNKTPPRDEQVIAQAAGVPLNASPEEARAIMDAWAKQFAVKNEKSGPNPIAFAQRMRDLQKAQALGLSPKAAGLGEIGTAKMLMVTFEFTGTDTIAACDADGNYVTDVTTTGPLHNNIPDPAGTGDNGTVWTDDFSIDWYNNLIFGDGVGVIRTDLNDGAGVDLSGVSATNWYAEQSEGLYDLQGEFYPEWIQVNHSEAYYGWEGGEANADNLYPCDGTPSGYGFEFVIDVINKINEMNPDFDWAQYDVDGNGIVDHFMVVHAGVGNEAGGGAEGNYAIWSHSWDVYCDRDGDGNLDYGCVADDGGTPDDPSDDILVANYTVVPEDADIGVVVHEYGHDIGLPDYYDQTGVTSNSTAHWIVMSGGSWNGPLGGSHPAPFNPWARYFFGWEDPLQINYDDPPRMVTIGQSDPTPPGTEDSVWIHLPDQVVAVPNLAGDGAGLHAILGNMVVETLTREFDLSGTTAPAFSFDTWFDIELDWDYTYVQVSTDGGATWTNLLNNEGVFATTDPNSSFAWWGPGGLTGTYQGTLTYDLSAYAGGTVLFRFAYVTDQAVQNPGIWVDNFSLDDNGTNLYFSDLEDPSDWTIDGWEVVPYDLSYPHYYMLEWRNGQGSIASYGQNFNYYSIRHDGEGWMRDTIPLNVPGLAVWYRNNRYDNNQAAAGGREFDPPAFGPKGELLLVDSHYEPVTWSGGLWDPTADNPDDPGVGNFNMRFSNRRAASDGAFGLQDTPPWLIHDYADINNPVMDFGSRPAVSAFHDSMRSVPGFLYPGGAYVYRVDRSSSVVIPGRDIYTTRIRGLDATGTMPGPDLTAFWGWTVGGQPLGSGHPGDSDAQWGLHVRVVDQAEDGSYGVVEIYNARWDVDGVITQTSNTDPTVEGSTVEVNFSGQNVGGALDAFFIMPLDPDEEYVMGSAYGGATPLTAAYAAQLAAERGLDDLAALAANAAPDQVVAVAFIGQVGTAEELNFGFSAKVVSTSGAIHHSVAMFNGSHFIGDIHSDILPITDNSTYPVERSRRFDVVRDTFIDGTRPDGFFGTSETLWVGFNDQMRPLVYAQVVGIPADAAIDQAYLYLYVTEGRGFGGWAPSVINVFAHPVTTPWLAEGVNWWTPWTNAGGDFGPAVGTNHLGSGKIGTWLRLDVTDWAKDVVRSRVNNGLILTSTPDSNVPARYGLASKEHWSGNVGYVRIYYRTAN